MSVKKTANWEDYWNDKSVYGRDHELDVGWVWKEEDVCKEDNELRKLLKWWSWSQSYHVHKVYWNEGRFKEIELNVGH